MLRLKRIFKNYEETGSLNAQVNLYGFIDDQRSLPRPANSESFSKSRGVDYECLDGAAIDGLTKRLESAFRLFDENCRSISTSSNAITKRSPTSCMKTPS